MKTCKTTMRTMGKQTTTALQFFLVFFFSLPAFSSLHKNLKDIQKIRKKIIHVYSPSLKKYRKKTIFRPVNKPPLFDIPVTYNSKVKNWIQYFQTYARKDFKIWLERSSKYLPLIKYTLKQKGLPQDLAYLAMIESGFSSRAVSHASAVGYWQFIKATAQRYGLKISWWIDERRDFQKSTLAAARYLADLYKMFRSWYLAAAAYNMGENRLKRLIRKYKTKNFWVLSRKRDFPTETKNYIPKLIAALLIAKAPRLYGFHHIRPHAPYRYEYFYAPGGTDLVNLSRFLGIPYKKIKRLNPELIHGFIPKYVSSHRIRIPKGYSKLVSKYVSLKL
ncbi:MAG: murein transglycosylase [Bdellovibrio sp.]|nr:MAG: murein transglycosylase [Bdellovibrio sp.]